MGLFDNLFASGNTSMPGDYGPGDAPNQPAGLMGGFGDMLKDPRKQAGLLAFANALIQAGAPRPGGSSKGAWIGGLGSAMGEMTKGQLAYDQQQQANEFKKLQMAHLKAQNDQLTQEAAAKRGAAERATSVQGLLSGNPALTLGAQMGDVGPTNTNAARIPQNPMDAYGTRASILENAGYMPEGMQLRNEAKKLEPEVSKYETLMGPNGQPQLTALFKNASTPKAISGLSQLDDPNKPFGRTGGANTAYQNYEINKAMAGRSHTNVNMPAPEKAAMVEMAKNDAKTVETLRNNAIAAGHTKGILQRMRSAVESDKTANGIGAEVVSTLQNVAVTLGDKSLADRASTNEQYLGDVANLVREKIKALGSGTAVSNVDLLFTKQSMPDLLKTKEGKRKLLNAMEQDIDYIRTEASGAEKHFRSNKGSLDGWASQPANTNGGFRIVE